MLGTTVAQMKIDAQEQAKVEVQAEVAEQKQEADAAVLKSATLLYTRLGMSVEEIAHELNETPDHLYTLLRKAGVVN